MVSVQVEVVEDKNGESLDDIEQARVAEGFKLDYFQCGTSYRRCAEGVYFHPGSWTEAFPTSNTSLTKCPNTG